MRILIVAEQLNSVVQTFARSLAQQKQEVTVLTSSPATWTESFPFQVITPFKKWSWMEGIRFLPRLLQMNPDIVHFFFTDGEHRPRMAQWVLASFLTSLPQKTSAASFFAEKSLRSFRDRSFLRLLDVNTFGTRSQLMRVKRQKILPQHALTEVLPPLDFEGGLTSSPIRGDLEQLVRTLGPYVLVPDPVPANLNVAFLRSQGIEVLALSENFRSRASYYCTGPLSLAERDFLFRRARALLLAESDLSVLELRRYHEWGERCQLPLLVTPYQNELLPGLCVHGRSGWVLDQGLADLERLFELHPNLILPRDYEGYSGHQLLDNTLNELLRLYQRAFLTRWT